MPTGISLNAGVRFTAPSPNQPDKIRHRDDWYDPDNSAQGEPLMLEALTRYGQPISCSIVDRGWVFVSHGQDNLCIREQIQMIHLQTYVGGPNETDFRPDQEISVGWASSSDQRMSALAAGYPARQPELSRDGIERSETIPGWIFDYWLVSASMTADIGFVLQGTETPHFDVGILPNAPEEELQAPLHPIIQAFAEGIADMRPAESTRETAALIVEAATEKAVAKEIEVDDDGALSFELRLNRELLVIGELSIEGNLHINVYNDRHPNPDATIDEIWIKHMPQASVDDLMDLL